MIGLNRYEAAVILSWKVCDRAGAARHLYSQARRRGFWMRLLDSLAGKPRHLLELEQVSGQCATHSHTDDGLRTVAIERIRGSVQPCRDLDAAFRPIGDGLESRWTQIVTELEAGKPLPPVHLIQVGDIYFVKDGHCPVSVARALGQLCVEAEVEVWQVAGLLHAGEKAAAHQRQSGAQADAVKAKQAGVV